MHDRDRRSDEVRVADAVEQAQHTAPEPADALDRPAETPIEVPPADWHEQHRDVGGADEDDRDEYRQ
jgi:hypothetical protein